MTAAGCGARRHGFAARPSGGRPQGSSVGTTTGRGHAHLKGGRPARNRPRQGMAKAVKDDKARKAPSVFRSGARVRVAQSRHGERSVRAPHFGLPDRHSCERPPPLRLTKPEVTAKETGDGRRPDREVRGRRTRMDGDDDPGAIALRERRVARPCQPRQSAPGSGRRLSGKARGTVPNPVIPAEAGIQIIRRALIHAAPPPAPYAGALHLDPGLRRGDGRALGRRFELRHSSSRVRPMVPERKLQPESRIIRDAHSLPAHSRESGNPADGSAELRRKNFAPIWRRCDPYPPMAGPRPSPG